MSGAVWKIPGSGSAVPQPTTTRRDPWGIQRLVSTYPNHQNPRSVQISILGGRGGRGCSGKSEPKVPRSVQISIFGGRGEGLFWKVKTQSAKICQNFNFGWGCSEPNSRTGVFCAIWSKFSGTDSLSQLRMWRLKNKITKITPNNHRYTFRVKSLSCAAIYYFYFIVISQVFYIR